ncbi:hypothetical protein BHM03_00011225 [Ensete ventricosum]|nr:hypothetical protein BHM03_00011225 [Ensete ventricosum]
MYVRLSKSVGRREMLVESGGGCLVVSIFGCTSLGSIDESYTKASIGEVCTPSEMAMASAVRRLSSSAAKTQPFLRSSLCYMASLPSEAVYEKEVRVSWPKQLNAPLEVVDPEIADIIELEKARQWKVLPFGTHSLLGRPPFAESSEMKLNPTGKIFSECDGRGLSSYLRRISRLCR